MTSPLDEPRNSCPRAESMHHRTYQSMRNHTTFPDTGDSDTFSHHGIPVAFPRWSSRVQHHAFLYRRNLCPYYTKFRIWIWIHGNFENLIGAFEKFRCSDFSNVPVQYFELLNLFFLNRLLFGRRFLVYIFPFSSFSWFRSRGQRYLNFKNTFIGRRLLCNIVVTRLILN